MFFTRGRRRADVLAAVEQLADHLGSASFDALALELAAAEPALEKLSNPSAAELWDEYLSQVAYFNGALIEVGGLAPDIEAVQGFIPAEIAERVNAFALDTSLLSVNLRGYQAFGAKFALMQERAILGDEMGLGKTVEALAAIGHLWSGGETHSFVVCPASVLVNWIHETERHTDLRAYRIHGAERDRNLRQWTSRGGIGVTTFESLRGVPPPRDVDLALLVVDEAHYVKNPYARRTEAVRRWIAGSERTLFLTGTPMENRVEEFRTLVGHLRPAIASRLSAVDGLAGAATFRKTVAPVYLRRNQADVLEELPPRIETEEWVEFDSDDFNAYRAAVLSGNFMAMRQAAFVPGTIHGSAKLGRLVEIAHEAAANGRKVVVFSFFLQVLKAVTTALGDLAVGPLTGAVPPIQRQRLVDEFSSRREPAVLISQIQAGGVGSNMQAASVVILTEPQWKPTSEDQAVARCHRMGQARPVDVHRLLADDSVDRRMLEILARKELLFDEYVRRSELKDISPDAVDISHLKETSIVATQAEAERRIIEVERRRMGLD